MLFIFDLDGTLVDTKELHRSALRSALEKTVPNLKIGELEEQLEARPTNVKLDILEELGYNFDRHETYKLKQQYTVSLVNSVVFYSPELSALLDNLKANGHKLALVSNASSMFVYTCLCRLVLTQFNLVTSAEFFSKSQIKPSPECYNWVINQLDFDKKDVIIFEDSALGIEAANKTGAGVEVVNNQQHTINKIKKYI